MQILIFINLIELFIPIDYALKVIYILRYVIFNGLMVGVIWLSLIWHFKVYKSMKA